MSKTNKYPPEVRERAVQLVQESRKDRPSLWAAVESIAPMISCSTVTLHEWVKIDVAFANDQMRARTGHPAHNLAILKHITLNLIRLDPIKRKGGIRAGLFIAATSDRYREHLLGLA